MLTYEEALSYIHNLNRFGVKLGLQNILNLLHILGDPHKGIKIIHVAGTNGKGSTCAMIDSILRACGFNVGLYTSPYLQVFNERIRVNGKNIPDNDIARLTQRIQGAIKFMEQKGMHPPTEFEVVTALGFLYFKEQDLDFLVLEVGMGGRLDATNVVNPLVSVITPISLDHQQYLGGTLKNIAREKCGIIKKGVPVVTSYQEPEVMEVIESKCKELNCPLIKVLQEDIDTNVDKINIFYNRKSNDLRGQTFNLATSGIIYKDLKTTLLGEHQVSNAATAVGAIEALRRVGVKIEKRAVYSGLINTRWPGRLEILSNNPTVLIDGAHNIAGIRALKKAVNYYFPKNKIILVMGVLNDKDYEDMVKEILSVADVIITTSPENPRALVSRQLAEVIIKAADKILCFDDLKNQDNNNYFIGKVEFYDKKKDIYSVRDLRKAIDIAFHLSSSDDVIIFTGSLYLIGLVRTAIK